VTGPFHSFDDSFDGYPMVELYEMVPYENAKGMVHYHRCRVGSLPGSSDQLDVINNPRFGRRFYMVVVRGAKGRIIDQSTVDLRRDSDWPYSFPHPQDPPADNEGSVVRRLKAEAEALRARAEAAEAALGAQAGEADEARATPDIELDRLRAENERLAAELAKAQAIAGEQLTAVEREMAQWAQRVEASGRSRVAEPQMPSMETMLNFMKLLDAVGEGPGTS